MSNETIIYVCIGYGVSITVATFFIAAFNMVLAVLGKYLPKSSNLPLYFLASVFIALDSAHLIYSVMDKGYITEDYYILCNIIGVILLFAAYSFVSSIQADTEGRCLLSNKKDATTDVYESHVSILKGIKRWTLSVLIVQVVICFLL